MVRRHHSPFCGRWYPDDSGGLKELLARLFESSEQRTGSHPLPGAIGCVVPHAGLEYSGTVAAAAYRHMRESQPRRVIVLGFSHRRAFAGVWIPDVDVYATSIGETAVDSAAIEQLKHHRLFQEMPESQMCDHSLEIQLPLLQEALPGTPIVPLYVGTLSPENRREAARALDGLMEPGTVIVASSDLTHYGPDFRFTPFPTDTLVRERLRDLDQEVMDGAGSLDSRLFQGELRRTGSTTCGVAPISLLLETLSLSAGPEIFQERLDYQTSGEITGDFGHSVSYGALGYFPADCFLLNEEDRKLLLDSTRHTLRWLEISGERRPEAPAHMTPGLSRQADVFVTLHRRGQLRGCVGYVGAQKALGKAAPELLISAATNDARFRPLQPGETGCDIEISVLSPMKRVARPAQVRAGEHGAMLASGDHHGILLPQVASERGMNRSEFLHALAVKAQAARSIYDDPMTKLFVFRVQAFGTE